MARNKRAQMQQLFIYLSAIIVIGFLVLFGFRMISKVWDQRCVVEEKEFFSALERTIDRSSKFGYVSDVVIPVPCDYHELCFVDKDLIGVPETELTGYKEAFPTIWANAVDNVSFNVYLKLKQYDTSYPIFYDERIETLPGNPEHLCIESSRAGFIFWVKGNGNGVYVYGDED